MAYVSMKTIIIKNVDDRATLTKFIKKLEKYTDRQIKDAVICTRYLDADNYNTIMGELKDATSLNDYDLFIVGLVNPSMETLSLQAINKAHTLVCTTGEYDSAKNFIIMI